MANEKYVQLDGAWYQIGDDEHTTTGLVIPPLTEWFRSVPDGATIILDAADDQPSKPKARKKG